MDTPERIAPPGALLLNRTQMPFALDRGVAARAPNGHIVLATDHTLEYEWRRIFAGLDGVAVYQSRIPSPLRITPETLGAMEAEIAGATEILLPGETMDVVGYACTSGTIVIGEERVFARIRAARPAARCTTPITAAVAGLEALGARRIAMLTPYVDAINRMMRDFVTARGIEVPVMGSFNHDNDNEVARIDAASVKAAVLELGRHPAVDAVFVACTSIRVAEAVAPLEAELGKPVTSSNHAMAWHALRLAGVGDAMPQWGRLFTA
jgi:maleate isomerase